METWRRNAIIVGSIGYLAVWACEVYLDRKTAKEEARNAGASAYAKHLCDLEAEELRHKHTMEEIKQKGLDDEKRREEENKEFEKRIAAIVEKHEKRLSEMQVGP